MSRMRPASAEQPAADPARRPPRSAARLALVAVAALAAACSPPVREPDVGVPLPASWSGGSGRSGEIADAWWSELGDPSLDALVDEVLERNHDLRAAAARLAAAASQARIAGASLLPMVGAGFAGSRERSVFVGLPIPGGDDILVNRFTRLGVSLDAVWEIDLWGRVRAGKQAALADAEAAAADFEAARLSLAAQTARAWFGLAEARLQVELAEATAASWRSSAEQVRARFERGTRPALDVRLALTNVAAADAALERRRLALDVLTRQLEVLGGRYPSATLASAGELPSVDAPPPAGLPSELLRRRPDIVAAERRLAAAHERLWEAKAALFPRLSLTASGGTTSDELADLTSRSFSVWSIAGNAVQPLFESGRLLAGVDLAESQAQELLASYGATVLEALREVESALASERHLAAREVHLEDNVEQSARSETLAVDRYSQGLESYATVLEAQRRTAIARSDLLVVRRERLDARIDLFRALGGGYERPSDESVPADDARAPTGPTLDSDASDAPPPATEPQP